jgi:hypothetical protein
VPIICGSQGWVRAAVPFGDPLTSLSVQAAWRLPFYERVTALLRLSQNLWTAAKRSASHGIWIAVRGE